SGATRNGRREGFRRAIRSPGRPGARSPWWPSSRRRRSFNSDLPTAPVYMARTQHAERNTQMGSILWAIFVIVLVVWLLGLIASIGGSLIHLLLIVAAAILIYNLTVGRNPR